MVLELFKKKKLTKTFFQYNEKLNFFVLKVKNVFYYQFTYANIFFFNLSNKSFNFIDKLIGLIFLKFSYIVNIFDIFEDY